MKKLFLLFLFTISCLFCSAASSMTVCFSPDAFSGCEATNPEGMLTWHRTCGAFSVRGIGICSDSSLKIGSGDDTYCYCKLLSPYYSNWVYAGKFSSEQDCASSCSEYCIRNLTVPEDFPPAQ